MSEKKLKPCFCGRTPEIVTRDVEPQEDRFFSGKAIMFVLCECGQCLFDGAFHEGFSDEEDAVNAWNYRVAPSPVPQEAPDPGHVEFWSVEVGVNGVPILRIETSMLSGHPDIGKYAEWVREAGEHLLAFIGPDRSLPAAPAPVEALPEGCPETAFFDPMDGQIHSDEKSGEEVVVEIHPVGIRARLAALGRAASLPDAKNVLDARCICGHTFGEHGPELNCGMFVPSSDDSEQATPPVTNKRNPHA